MAEPDVIGEAVIKLKIDDSEVRNVVRGTIQQKVVYQLGPSSAYIPPAGRLPPRMSYPALPPTRGATLPPYSPDLIPENSSYMPPPAVSKTEQKKMVKKVVEMSDVVTGKKEPKRKAGAGLLEALGLKGGAPYLRFRKGRLYGGLSGLNVPASIESLARGEGLLGRSKTVQGIAQGILPALEKLGMASAGAGEAATSGATAATTSAAATTTTGAMTAGSLAAVVGPLVIIAGAVLAILFVVKMIFKFIKESKVTQYMQSYAASAVENIMMAILYVFINLYQKIKDIFSIDVPAGIQAYIDGFQQIFSMLGYLIDDTLTYISTYAELLAFPFIATYEFIKGIVSGIIGYFSAVVTLFTTGESKVYTALGNILSFVLTFPVKMFQKLTSLILKLLDSIIGIIFDAISLIVVGSLNAILSIFTTLGFMSKETAHEIMETVTGVLMGIRDSITWFFDTVKRLYNTLTSSIIRSIETVISTITGALDSIVTFFAKAIGRLLRGLGDRITGKKSGIISGVTSFIGGVF